MKVWRSLRVRLIFSYIALALLLLTFTGYIFSNALSIYATSVQSSQQALYLKQAVNIMGEAQSRHLSGDETLALLRKDLPDVTVQVVDAPSDKSVEMGKQIKGSGAGVVTAPLNKVTLPATSGVTGFLPTDKAVLPDITIRSLALSVKQASQQSGDMVFLYSAKPAESSFTLPVAATNKENSPVTLYRFTLSPSAFGLLSNLYRQVLAVLALALVLALFIGWLLSHWLARPLSRLVAATEAVAGGNFLETVDRSGIIELDRLGEHFNRMVLYLRESFHSLAAERDTAKRFAADAAHELKTPVATLRAYHDVLTEHPERLQQVTPAVGRQIKRMEQVISGLLQIANLAEGSNTVLEPGDLCSIVRRLEPGYQALAEDGGHHLTVAYQPDPVPVLADRHLVELVLNNLMDNAFKYTESGGAVALTIKEDSNQAMITVQDFGRGIAPEELPYIFDRFHRGVDTQSIAGTGLGLAITREAVKRMNGELSAESEVGHGSRFSIRLPLLSVGAGGGQICQI